MNSTKIRTYLNTPKWKSLAAALCGFVCFSCFVSSAQAALSLTITENTSSAITMEIGGSLDEDTTGPFAGYLGIKMNWEAGGGHTEWFTGTSPITIADLHIDFDPPAGRNYLAINNNNNQVHDSNAAWGDCITILGNVNPQTSLVAGTEVSGSLRITAEQGTFTPANAKNLFLVSGLSGLTDTDQWQYSEAQAEVQVVPESSTAALLLGLGAVAWTAIQRRRS